MAKHAAPAARITRAYHSAWSAACSYNGDGNCDGSVDPDAWASEPCACPCHKGDPMFDVMTVEEMERAHARYHHDFS